MSSQILFFATKNDLSSVLDSAEKKRQIKYVRTGLFRKPNPESFLRGMDIPDFGVASNESADSCDTFLVCDQNTEIRPREIRGQGYAFDQLINPQTISFTPGGLWGDNVLLHGRFATASTAVPSLELLKIFRSLVHKRFEKIKAFYVGKEASQMLEQGKRLTIAEQSPRAFDLSRK